MLQVIAGFPVGAGNILSPPALRHYLRGQLPTVLTSEQKPLQTAPSYEQCGQMSMKVYLL